MPATRPLKIIIGISSCLLGNKVRYDGSDKELKLITEELAKYYEFLPICPEMAIGLGVPRAPIQMVGSSAQQRVVPVDDETKDVTPALLDYSIKTAQQLNFISGYIFKKNSPSCGLAKVKIHSGKRVSDTGVGLFAQQMVARYPTLPMTEEDQLQDDEGCRTFLQRVENYHHCYATTNRCISW